MFLMVLFIVSPHSQHFVIRSSDKRKPLFSCGVVCELTKLEDFPGQVVEHRAINSEMHTNQMIPGLERESKKSHIRK